MFEYTAESIKRLKGLEGVRKRPAMYIGDVGKKGFHHLAFEIIDNAIDEVLARYANYVKITIHKDGSISVEDNGRGIPVDIHPETNTPAIEVVFMELHAGGKFENSVYKISGGLHGVGASVVNALSEWTDVLVKRNNKTYKIKFSKGKKVEDLKVISDAKDTGTIVRFKPDPEIFTEYPKLEFDYEYLADRLREISFLVPQVRIELVDEITNKKQVFHSPEGLKDFIKYLDITRKHITPIFLTTFISNSSEFMEVEIALCYNDSYDEVIVSFVNTVNTKEGGTHVTGFKSSLTRSINDIGRKMNLIKKEPLQGDDVREGLTAIIHAKLSNPIFEGQTKIKLANDSVKSFIEKEFYERFSRWLEENPKIAQIIIEKALENQRARLAARKAREAVRRKNFIESDVLPGKLADCITKEKEISELFIVEGESAGGSAKQGRNREFQAILPLKGKILNVEKKGLDKALDNEELRSIISAIGCGIKDSCKPEESRYGKIIIMTDADIDGAHIRTLLLTLFYRYFYNLIEAGMLYIAQPPLYRIQKAKTIKYAYSDEELHKILKEFKDDNVIIQRYKGLGEMNPEQLWETTMNPETRILKRVTVEDAAQAERWLSVCMGLDVAPRKEFIEKYALSIKDLDI
ncbi:MAG: DNA gyrase subunit B [candidate division WOR-3 bacterium]|nr:DNA gyrase subunit B [candidate division WOR-3 bacterium]MCX7948379.1 DNA gyrase subunit B [candidate division WOR-3 bacterium]MDW8151279.1 DNA gyrase subunit B [candidate division WOR-3 bacterium]